MCGFSPVVIFVCADDVISCVSHFESLEAPGEGVRFRVRLHSNCQRQAVP